jgi:hypothetical protein
MIDTSIVRVHQPLPMGEVALAAGID